MIGEIRGLGVRGLGEQQRKEILATESKIVSYLSISPYTYEQLWKISRIQRNALRIRLKSLLGRKLIFAHRYTIPHTFKFYGYMHIHPIRYWTPIQNHIYYLLDSSRPESQQMLKNYFTRTE